MNYQYAQMMKTIQKRFGAVSNQGMVTKEAGSTVTGLQGHGPGGTFSFPGMDQQVFNAMMLPHTGLQAILPFRLTNVTDPVYSIVTGVTATSGEDPTNECDDPPFAGATKLCMHTAPLGRISLKTRTYNIEHAGEITNRGEFMDLSLVGNPLTNAAVPSMPTPVTAADALRNEASKALFELAAGWATRYAPMLYTGSPLNNTAGGGYKEYHGFQRLINTGYQDLEKGVACPAADSLVVPFGNQLITSATADIVGKIQRTSYMLQVIASRTGMGEVRWVLSVPYSLFYDLSEVWAYYYWTRVLPQLSFSNSFQLSLNAGDATTLRDQMRGDMGARTGQFLPINGTPVQVVLDDSIPTTEIAPGVFSGDIYLIPLTVRAGQGIVTFMEMFNWASPNGPMEMASILAPGGHYYTSDAGAYMWHRLPPHNLCVESAVWSRPRLVVRTPYLAGRITGVAWSPQISHERSPFHSSGYHVNGGRTDRQGYGPSFFPPTSA